MPALKHYNVLWINSELDNAECFINHAIEEGIDIKSCSTAEDAISELKEDINFYDGVIVNSTIKADPTQSSATTVAMHNLIRKIHELRAKRYLPYFVMAVPVVTDEIHRELINTIELGKYYTNHSNTSRKELFTAIKEATEDSAITAIRHQYEDVLKVFELIGDAGRDSFFEILLAVEGKKDINHKVYYTPLRIVIECMFRHANQIGLLHDQCVKEELNLTESSLFLAGEPTKYLNVRCGKAHFPKLIANNIKHLLFITGGASHTTSPDETEIINLQDYWKSSNTPYLLYAQTLILCDILLWYKQYARENSNRDENMRLWIERTVEKNIVGVVERDEDGDIHCESCFMNPLNAVSYLGKTVEVKIFVDNTNTKTKFKYPNYAIQWE